MGNACFYYILSEYLRALSLPGSGCGPYVFTVFQRAGVRRFNVCPQSLLSFSFLLSPCFGSSRGDPPMILLASYVYVVNKEYTILLRFYSFSLSLSLVLSFSVSLSQS